MRNSIRTRLAVAFIALAASLLLLVGAVLAELASFSDAFSALSLVDSNGRERIAISSTEINNQLRNLSAADEFTIPASSQQIYYSPVQFSEHTGEEPYMLLSVPITNVRKGEMTDVLVAESRERDRSVEKMKESTQVEW